MSRKKLYKIDQMALNEALKENKVTLKQLSEEIDRDYNTFNKYIRHDGLSKLELDYIARRLDRAPEYLTGETKALDEFNGSITPLKYSFHEYQSLSIESVLHDFITLHGKLDYCDYSPREKGQIQKALIEALDRIETQIEENRERQRKAIEEQSKEG